MKLTENKHPFYLIEFVTLPLSYLQTLLVKKNKHPMSSLYLYISVADIEGGVRPPPPPPPPPLKFAKQMLYNVN